MVDRVVQVPAPRTYNTSCMPEYAIGLDLGGTNLRAAAIDRGGRILDKVAGSSQLPGGREALFNDMATAIETLRDRQGREDLSGIGVAVPGFILLKEGIVKNANNIPALEDYPLRLRSREETGRESSSGKRRQCRGAWGEVDGNGARCR